MAAGILKEFTLNHPIEILARGMVVLFPEPINQKAEAVLISNGINPEGYICTTVWRGYFEGYSGHCNGAGTESESFRTV